MSTRRIKLVVAYDGTDYSGWAPQRGRRTVHGILTEAVRQVSGEEIETIGASRTDSGAHARGQVVHFDDPTGMPVGNWLRALNNVLPTDLVAVEVTPVPEEFHARFWALARTYHYVIRTGPRDPRLDRYAHWYGRPLDCKRMHDAAQALVGEHDFEAFSEEIEPGTNTRREIFEVRVNGAPDGVRIKVRANAFVRGMMRRIAGSLWEVGRGRWPEERPGELLGTRRDDSNNRPVVLPAKGLTLVNVAYGRWPKDRRRRYKQSLRHISDNGDNYEQDIYG